MKLDKEMLALAVAAEWDSQKDEILQSTMHIVRIIKFGKYYWHPYQTQTDAARVQHEYSGSNF